MPRVKKTETKSSNEMDDTLRGSMDVAEYKHVVLGLIFLKYISDALFCIMGAYEKQMLPLYKRIVECERQSRTLMEVSDNLLPKLISGELSLKECNKFMQVST